MSLLHLVRTAYVGAHHREVVCRVGARASQLLRNPGPAANAGARVDGGHLRAGALVRHGCGRRLPLLLNLTEGTEL